MRRRGCEFTPATATVRVAKLGAIAALAANPNVIALAQGSGAITAENATPWYYNVAIISAVGVLIWWVRKPQDWR